MLGRESKACGAKWRCLAADLSDMEGNDQYNHAPPHISANNKQDINNHRTKISTKANKK